ncbi:hypothetical protein K8I28_03600, partial [bacterium]|nr:hypothetical protein [bacterium]
IGIIVQRLLYAFLGVSISFKIGGGGRVGALLAAIFISFIAYEIYNILFNSDITKFANRYSKGVIDRKLQILFLLLVIVTPILNIDYIKSPFWIASILILLLNGALTLATDKKVTLAPSLTPKENRSFFIFLYDIAWVLLGVYTIVV